MKAESKEALKEFFGELAIQMIFGLIVLGLGGVGLAYIFIGWGVLWLLLPFGFMLYLLAKNKFNNSNAEN
ncbi:hypothetical protein [Acinetobacter sp. TR11]|uniref:hypothetical protein n=1 Tax=Acinetobacter sp. TR11 TaxID=3003393 RepID=UPI0022AC79E4|nr:hypothetical protein [Acinetobacter sp. TR11]WAU74331.1 hypothetical protein O1450_04295 [Acinetobacter sp. TR11]